MNNLYPLLGLIFTFSLLLNYLSFNSKISAIEIVNDMGIGYNLGGLFDCYLTDKKFNNPDDQITLSGNKPPTKQVINRLKKYGFKTIRFPITWSSFIDDFDNINSKWMLRVKEVIDWIIDNNMYCIINMHRDEQYDWIKEGLKSLNKYKKLWMQISNEFKDYDYHLIFESISKPYFWTDEGEYDYLALFNFTQAFIDVVRNSGGNNKERLLLITGMISEYDFEYNSNFMLPKDPYDKLALSVLYYQPYEFAKTEFYEYSWIDINGNEHIITSVKKWGSNYDYYEMVNNFEFMKTNFADKGFPVIISETGVFTEEKKETESIKEYLNTIFSFSSAYNGIMACLWDTSNAKKEKSDYRNYMNYYNREKDKWYDEDIRDNFKKISKGKNVNPTNFFSLTNILTSNNPNPYGDMIISIGTKKPIKVTFNVKYDGYFNIYYRLLSCDINGEFEIHIGEKYLKREYDGTLTFIIILDSYKREFTKYIAVQKILSDFISIFNKLTVEFEESYLSLDIKAYKEALSNNF